MTEAADTRPGSPRVRVYIACSLDGFIAGDDDDLSWLGGGDKAPQMGPGCIGFEQFMDGVGALLMGRRTHDAVQAMDVPWPYGQRPVLVPTHRPLQPAHTTVRPVDGTIGAMVDAAIAAADGRDVYLDGGALIRQGLDAGLVDELIVTMVPIVLGSGVPLFAGTSQRHRLRFVGHARYGDMLQVRLEPADRDG